MELKVQTDPHLKRLACQLYAQMPEDKREALQLLGYIRQIIFCLGEDWETVSRSAPVLPFGAEKKGRGAFPRAVPGDQNGPRDKANQE